MHRIAEIQNLLQIAFERLERRSFAFAVFVAAVKRFNEDNCVHLAASVAYYAIFSIFPLILGLVTLASFLLQSAEARDAVIAGITGLLPGSAELVRRNIELVLRERGTIGVFAMIFLLWSAKEVFGAITTSLNLAWNVKETRPFLRLTALQLALVFAVGFFLALSFAVTAVLQLLFLWEIPILGRGPLTRDLWNLLGGLVPLVLTIIAFYFVYRFVPNIKVKAEDAWPGAIAAGLLFEIAKNAFLFYTSGFANYRLVYGSVGAVIALLFWAWVSGVILLFGAEISAQCAIGRNKRQTP